MMLAGSTHIGFGPHRFSVQYTEQDIAEGSQPSHRGLAINPLYAEGQYCMIKTHSLTEACCSSQFI